MNSILNFRFSGIVAFFAMIAVFNVAAMFLWNTLIPIPVLDYWQVAGLIILAQLLFIGLGYLEHVGKEALDREGGKHE